MSKPVFGSAAVAPTGNNKTINAIANLLADHDGDGRPDRLGEKVTVRGRATVDTNVFSKHYLLFYMQDSTAGIMVFSDSLDVSVSKGDSLQVTGRLELHSSKPEIIVEDLKVFKTEKRIPEAQPLSRASKDPERYRGLLVSGDAIVQETSPSEGMKMIRMSPVNSPVDSLHVFVSRSNIHYEDFIFSALKTGDRIHIRGILIRYISDFTGQIFYQVLPRSREDLIINNLQPMVTQGSFVYADIDTASGTIYTLLESGLWEYNLSDNSWRFLDALGDFEGSFNDYEFGFNAQTNQIQLWSRGMGKLYSVDPQTHKIQRKDHSFRHRNQFGHFPFYRDSTLYAFGGYGFWNYHNMIIHFNRSRNEWELQPVDHSSPYPGPRVPATGIYDRRKDRLYIFGGRGTDSEYAENRNSGSREFRDIWSFSFDSKKWEKVMTLGQLENSSSRLNLPSEIGEINKQSSSLYLPDKQLWFIPAFDPKPPFDGFNFRVVNLSSRQEEGIASPDFGRSNNFLPTNYFYNPNGDEVVFAGIDNLTNANTSPLRIHRMPVDSLVAEISNQPFYLSAQVFYYLIGLAVIGGFLFWFYRNQATSEEVKEQESTTLSHHSLMQADWLNSQEKKLLEHLQEKDGFMETQEIEELMWSDIESYDYRRRLRNDILKAINKKFSKHYPDLGNLILRKKDPDDNRCYLYGLNKQLLEE